MDSDNTDFEIVRELGDLPPDSIITEDALGKMFDRHGVSVRRAVERGELPPPTRLFGKPIWTIKTIREHINQRLERARQESEKLNCKISQLSV